MSALVRAQPGASASVTTTLVRVESPSLITWIVKVAVCPLTIVCVSGDFRIVMCGLDYPQRLVGDSAGGAFVVVVAGVDRLPVERARRVELERIRNRAPSRRDVDRAGVPRTRVQAESV
jgi:hypothetical protein